jgi:hypothetical protein
MISLLAGAAVLPSQRKTKAQGLSARHPKIVAGSDSHRTECVLWVPKPYPRLDEHLRRGPFPQHALRLLTHIELLLVDTAHDIRIAEAFSAARDADLADRPIGGSRQTWSVARMPKDPEARTALPPDPTAGARIRGARTGKPSGNPPKITEQIVAFRRSSPAAGPLFPEQDRVGPGPFRLRNHLLRRLPHGREEFKQCRSMQDRYLNSRRPQPLQPRPTWPIRPQPIQT